MSLPDFPTPPLAPPGPPAPGPTDSLRGLWARLGPWHGIYSPAAGCLALSALAAVAEVLAPVLLGRLIDALLPGGGGLPAGLFGLYAVVLVASVVFDRWGDLVEVKVAGQLMAQVHVRLLSDRLLDAGETAPGRPTERAARLTQAAQAAGELFRSGVAGPIRLALAVVATVAMATLLSPSLGLAALVWSVLLLAGTVLIAPQTGRLADAEQRARSDATSHAADAMAALDQLRRQRAEAAEIERGLGLVGRARDRLMARTRYAEARLMIIGVLQAGFVLTVLWIGLARWAAGDGTPGEVAAAVGLALALMDNLQWAGQQVSLAQAARGALAGVLRDWPGGKRRLWWGQAGVEERRLRAIPGEQGLFLENVAHGPLKRLSLEIEPGEHTGVVGPQDMRGALLAVVGGQATPAQGTVRWGGVAWDPAHRPDQRDEVLRVPAQPVLFDRSVRDNLWLDGQAGALPARLGHAGGPARGTAGPRAPAAAGAGAIAAGPAHLARARRTAAGRGRGTAAGGSAARDARRHDPGGGPEEAGAHGFAGQRRGAGARPGGGRRLAGGPSGPWPALRAVGATGPRIGLTAEPQGVPALRGAQGPPRRGAREMHGQPIARLAVGQPVPGGHLHAFGPPARGPVAFPGPGAVALPAQRFGQQRGHPGAAPHEQQRQAPPPADGGVEHAGYAGPGQRQRAQACPAGARCEELRPAVRQGRVGRPLPWTHGTHRKRGGEGGR